MPATLILHCGPHKTGTSAIQAHLAADEAPGLIYPRTGRWPDGAHHLISFALEGLDRRGEIDIPSWDKLRPALMADLSAGTGDALISSEHLLPDLARQLIDAIAADLPGRFAQVRLLIVLRHPLERAASAYNQAVKDEVIAETRFPDAFLREEGARFHLVPLLDLWERMALPTDVLGYHPSGTLVSRVFAALGQPEPPDAPQRRNGSLNGLAPVALLSVNRLGLSGDDRTRLFDTLRERYRGKLWSGPSFPFSAGAARAYLAMLADDLAEVRARTGIDLTTLHPRPPARFRLDPGEAGAVIAEFANFDLPPQKTERLERIVGRFADGSGASEPASQAG